MGPVYVIKDNDNTDGGGKRESEFMLENSAMMYMFGEGLNITHVALG